MRELPLQRFLPIREKVQKKINKPNCVQARVQFGFCFMSFGFIGCKERVGGDGRIGSQIHFQQLFEQTRGVMGNDRAGYTFQDDACHAKENIRARKALTEEFISLFPKMRKPWL